MPIKNIFSIEPKWPLNPLGKSGDVYSQEPIRRSFPFTRWSFKLWNNKTIPAVFYILINDGFTKNNVIV